MCDTFVALPEATADASVIVGKNSDREPNEAHDLVLLPAADHADGETIRATHRSIPQAPRTYRVLLAKPFWIWGAEMGVNEHSVVIGNEAVFTKARSEREPGLLGMDLLRLGLERGASAEEAAAVICDHLQRYGQAGQAGHTKHLEYDNSYVIADPGGALVLETVGRDWVIQRVAGTRSISNGLTIHQDWDRASAGLSTPDVDIARHYANPLYTRFSDSRARQCRTTERLQHQRGSVTVAAAMALLRDHGERGDQPGFTPATGMTGMTVCAHAGPGPIRGTGTVGSMVAHVAPTGTTVWLTATSAPCLSAFKPVWLDAGLPDLGPSPSGSYDARSLWWRHEDLHRAVLADYADRVPLVRPVIADLEHRFFARVDDTPPEGRRALTEQCFAAADHELAGLVPAIRDRPVRRRPPRLYERAWRAHDRQAGR
jgi:secernin